MDVELNCTKTFNFSFNACLFFFIYAKLEEKAKRIRDLEDERLSWEERVRQLDRQRREMELRIKKTQDSVDEHVTQLSKQVCIWN